mgnify:FL=1
MTNSIKSIKSSTLRDNLSDVLDDVEKNKGQLLLIERHGQPEAALVNLDVLESVLDTLDKKLMAKLRRSRRQADRGKTVPFAEAFGEL